MSRIKIGVVTLPDRFMYYLDCYSGKVENTFGISRPYISHEFTVGDQIGIDIDHSKL